MRKTKEAAPTLIQIANVLSIIVLLFLIGVVIFFINEETISFTNESPYKALDKKYLPHIAAWREN